MSQINSKEIEEIASKTYSFIKDTLKISKNETSITLEELGKFIDNLDGSYRFDSSLSDFENGKIIKNKNSDTFEIVLNGSVKDEEKQRFLIAHELGHLFFHMPFFDKNENWKEYKGVFHDSATSRANWAVQEVEADLFSNYLLMPLDKLENSLSNASSEDGIDISIVADEFKISKNKLLNYALDYNLIKYVDA